MKVLTSLFQPTLKSRAAEEPVVQIIMRETNTASSWCVIAKIKEATPFGEGGKETKIGSKHFKPGAKVFIVDWYPGMCTTVTVVGHHRKSNRLITIDLHVKYLTDLNTEVVYKPYILEKIEERKIMGSATLTEDQAKEIRTDVEAWIHEEKKQGQQEKYTGQVYSVP